MAIIDEGIWQNIIAIEPPEPATFILEDRGLFDIAGMCRLSEDDTIPLRGVSQFQKIWPEGSQGSGSIEPFNFSGAPYIQDGPWGGTHIGLGLDEPGRGSTFEKLKSGPWYDTGGNLIANADRPTKGFVFELLQPPGLHVYDAWMAVLPEMTRYSYEFRISNSGSLYSIDVRDIDNTWLTCSTTLPGTTESERNAVAAELASQINSSTGASATWENRTTLTYLAVGEKIEGWGMFLQTPIGLTEEDYPEIASGGYGGLDFDIQGTEGIETIAVIT